MGDLDELYAERATRGRLRANVWYARQAFSAAARYGRGAVGRLPLTHWVDDLRNDIAHAFRTLLRRPGFTLVVVLTLALGIGATTAIFSVVDGVLLRDLPYPDSDRLVRVLEYRRGDGDPTGMFSREDFADLQTSGGPFASLSVFATGTRVLTGGGEAQEITAASVGPEFFRTLGVAAAIGRTITAEDAPGADQVAVLSDAFWRGRFAADPDIVGSTLTLDGGTFTVLGVMPRSFDYPTPDADVFIPASLIGCDDVNCHRASRFLMVVGRLAPGATTGTATTATRAVLERLAEVYPDTNAERTGAVISLRESLVGDVRPELLILLGAVGFLLLITCANVANLLLARSANRQREFAIRAAVGAGRSRVARQVLAESLVLAVGGGGLGFLLAYRGVDFLVSLGAGSIPRAQLIHTDLRVAAFTALASVLTGFVFGLLPSWNASRVNLQDDLRDGGRRGAAGVTRVGGRGVLVGVEAALAVILVTGAALLAESFWNLTRVDAGFTAENVLSLTIRTDGDVMGGEERNAYRRELVRGIKAIPGVVAVGGAKDLPLRGVSEAYTFALPGEEEEHPETLIVTGSYFDALGIPLLAGRYFDAGDETDQAPVVIVDEALARRHWPTGDAVGKSVVLQGRIPTTIVGVVGDVRYSGITQAPSPTLYILPQYGGRSSLTLFVRTASDPTSVADAARRVVWKLNSDQPVVVNTMRQVRSTTVAEPRFLTVLLGSFAGLAMVLALLGVYGVTAYETSRRTYEVGVRMALGAGAHDILRLVLAQGIAPMLVGVAVGLAGAGALSRVLAAMLFGVQATDASTFVAVPLCLIGLGLLAVYVPARRATRVDPKVALQGE